MDTLAANERSPNFIYCKREWHLPRMNRPHPLHPACQSLATKASFSDPDMLLCTSVSSGSEHES